MLDWSRHFHVPDGIYLNSHSAGCMPRTTVQRIESEFVRPWQNQGGDAWPEWLSAIDQYCEALGTVLGASAADICPTSNVTEGFFKYLTALPRSMGRDIILMHEDAFPSMGFVVQALKAQGYQLKLIDRKHDASDPTVWRRAIDTRIAAVLVTHVHSNTGVVSPVQHVAAHCRQKGVPCLVDVAQSVGIVPVDVTGWGVQAVFGSCLKWLCGGPGAGFMWVQPEHLQDLSPLQVGWFSHQNPFEFDIHNFEYSKTVKRFWGGTPSVMSYVAASEGIKALTDRGLDSIQAHNAKLKDVVLSHSICGMCENQSWSSGGTLCLEFDTDTADAIASRLKAKGCWFDRRGNVLRLSFHLYNTDQEAQQVGYILAHMD
jgi:selenocysteine lyase/cysteine desulfurase